MRWSWRSAVGIGLSVALLVWTLRDVELHAVWAVLRASNIAYFLAATLCATLIFPLRARRWRTILSPIDPHVPFGALWRSTAIGMMVNNVVPARAGELARAYALTREHRSIGFAAAFATLAIDRVFDAFVVLLLMLGAILSPSFPAGTHIAGQPIAKVLTFATGVALLFLAALYLVVFLPERVIGLYEAFARRVDPGVETLYRKMGRPAGPGLEARGRDALLAFASGLGVLRHPGRFFSVMLWTLAHWLLNGLGYVIAFKAVGIAVPVQAAFFLQGVVAIGVAVPSAPGFFGIFEAASKTALAVYGVDPTLAVSWAIGFHLLTLVPITLIGGYYFARLGLNFRELGDAQRGGGEPPRGEPGRDPSRPAAPEHAPSPRVAPEPGISGDATV
ncbi:MAG: lysylphosphatidylglycerol synthase transmembrane domain-containing protein [Gemmatimonadaceae bacterium]